MAKHNQTGFWGEQHAANFLKQLGYQILEQNWKYGKAEIDIIAMPPDNERQIIVFVEVKTRKSNTFGFPEQSISKKKQQLLTNAASAYCEQMQWKNDVRFDIIAITINEIQNHNTLHIKDAFFSYDL